MGSESQTEPRCLGTSPLRVNGRDVALELKEGPCLDQVEASACCTPERQASCCEPAAKADCCAPSAVGSCGCQ